MEISQTYAILHAKCPRCRQGAIFANSMYGFKAQKMHDTCSHCNLRYEREPGYFYVAMFVCYALNVAQIIGACMLTYLLTGNQESPWLYIGAVTLAVILCAPLNYRYSRVMLLHWFTPGLNYEPQRSK